MSEKLSDIVVCEKCGHKNKQNITHCARCGNEMYRDYYKGLWLRNTIITLILFLVPFFILFYLVNVEISTHSENQTMGGLEYSVDMNVRIVKSFLDERKQDLLSIAKLDIARLTEIQSEKSFFNSYLAENPWFDFVAVADPQGVPPHARLPAGPRLLLGYVRRRSPGRSTADHSSCVSCPCVP